MATSEAATETEPGLEVEADFPPHLMTIDRYRRLVDSDVFGPKDPVFLWRGRLVEKMTKGDLHVFSASSLNLLMARLVPEGWSVRTEQPIALADNSMPEPDLTVIRGSLRDYLNRPPRGLDVALVVEVSNSSLQIDSGEVLRAYASERIPVYWIVNIPKGRIEVYGRPTGPDEKPSYLEHRDYGPDDEVPVVLDGREVGRIAARDVLP
ncbi:Uma2 family endonuclease [Tundrisphaera lichenicola]|uniref:Uma2 family endonuclease n=1 Tax=Tundrisphaera lichenicola TaxID=2029860 RepID=UPI003EC0B770